MFPRCGRFETNQIRSLDLVVICILLRKRSRAQMSQWRSNWQNWYRWPCYDSCSCQGDIITTLCEIGAIIYRNCDIRWGIVAEFHQKSCFESIFAHIRYDRGDHANYLRDQGRGDTRIRKALTANLHFSDISASAALWWNPHQWKLGIKQGLLQLGGPLLLNYKENWGYNLVV